MSDADLNKAVGFIEKGLCKEALAVLLTLEPRWNDVTLLNGEFEAANRAYGLGLQKRDDYDIVCARVRSALLHMIGEMRKAMTKPIATALRSEAGSELLTPAAMPLAPPPKPMEDTQRLPQPDMLNHHEPYQSNLEPSGFLLAHYNRLVDFFEKARAWAWHSQKDWYAVVEAFNELDNTLSSLESRLMADGEQEGVLYELVTLSRPIALEAGQDFAYRLPSESALRAKVTVLQKYISAILRELHAKLEIAQKFSSN